MRSLPALFAAAACVALLACNSLRPCVKPDGPDKTEIRNFDTFTELDVRGSMNVRLVQADEHAVRIQAPANVLAHLRTRQDGRELTIGQDRCVKGGPIEVEVRVRTLRELDLNGSGSLQGEGMNTDELEIGVNGSGTIHLTGLAAQALSVHINGSGDATFGGTVDDQFLKVNGSGNLMNATLRSQTAKVTINGSGDAHLHVRQSLKVRINGSGTVYLQGSPAELDQTIRGSGRILQSSKSGDR